MNPELTQEEQDWIAGSISFGCMDWVENVAVDNEGIRLYLEDGRVIIYTLDKGESDVPRMQQGNS